MVYCVSQAGSLKIFNMETGAQVRPLARKDLSRPADCLHRACMPSINYVANGQTDFLHHAPPAGEGSQSGQHATDFARADTSCPVREPPNSRDRLL